MKDYGMVGANVTLTREAYADNYKDTVRYYSVGVDPQGNEYDVVWELEMSLEEYRELEDESEACDWDNPIIINERC